MLHLPFEESAVSTGPFRDAAGVAASGSGTDGTCSGSACPSLGQVGHSGSAAFFDGVDDYVDVPLNVSETAYGVALWFKTSCANCGIFSVDRGLRSAEGYDRYINLSNGNVCALIFTSDWANETKCTSGTNFADGKWHHVVHTYGGTVGGQQIWVDGVWRISGAKAASDFTAQDGINIGFSYGAGRAYFAGLLDEVRIFSRALTAGDVRALYTGSGPLLVLPFEKQWAADGGVQEDASGWQHDAVLYTSTGDSANKAVTGQVGSYALQFDGVDDYAVIPDDDTIDFDPNHDFAVAAWIKPASAQAWTATVDNNVIEKWSGAGGYPYSIRYLNQTAGANAGKISAGRWDGQNGPWLQSTTRIDDGRFHHVAFVKSGTTLALYVDGTSRASGQTRPPARRPTARRCTSGGAAARRSRATSPAAWTTCASPHARCRHRRSGRSTWPAGSRLRWTRPAGRRSGRPAGRRRCRPGWRAPTGWTCGAGMPWRQARTSK